MAELAELAQQKLAELKTKKDTLSKELAEVNKELKPLEAYLRASGVIEKPATTKRGRKAKEKA